MIPVAREDNPVLSEESNDQDAVEIANESGQNKDVILLHLTISFFYDNSTRFIVNSCVTNRFVINIFLR